MSANGDKGSDRIASLFFGKSKKNKIVSLDDEKKEVKMLSIKSMYIGVDNGNSINVEDIKTFNSYFKTDGNE